MQAVAAVPGGFSSIAVSRNDVIAAANFAVAEINQGKLNKIISAQSQVVAGVNYDLELELKAADGTMHRYQARVFVALPANGGKMQLTNFKEIS